MIQPEGIPVSEIFNMAAVIEYNLGPLGGLGPKFTQVGVHINSEFRHLNDCYQAPEREQLVHSTQRIQDSLGEFGPKLPQVSQVLAGFASELRGFAVQLNDLRNRAYAWQQAKNKNPDWENDQGLIDENNRLIGSVSMILTGDAGGGTYAGLHRSGTAISIPALALQAANEIAALYGGRRWQANGQHEGDAPLPPPPGPTEEQRQQQIDDILHGKFPPAPPPPAWGAAEERDYPWYQDVGNFLVDVGEGIVTALGETVEGILTLVPVLPAIASIPGVRDWAKENLGWDMPTWKQSGQAWVGLAKLGGAILLSPALVTTWALDKITGQNRTPQWMKDLRETGVNTVKGMVAWDEWGKNPGKAFGMLLTNVVTTVASGGVIAEAKGAAMASKFGRAAPVVQKGVSAVNYLRGTRAAMHDATLGLVMKIPKVSSVVEGLSKIPIVGHTFQMQNVPKVEVPAAHGLDRGASPSGVELPTGHTSVPITHTPAVEPVTTPVVPNELTTPRTPTSRTDPGSDPSTATPGSRPPGSHPESVVPPVPPIPGTHTPPPSSPAGRTDPGTTTPAGRTEPGTTTPGSRAEPGATGNRTDPGTGSRTDAGSRTPEARTDPGKTPEPSASKPDAHRSGSDDPAHTSQTESKTGDPQKPASPDPTGRDPRRETGRPDPDPTKPGSAHKDPAKPGSHPETKPDPSRTETTPSTEGGPARANESGTASRTGDPVVPPPVAPAQTGVPSGATSHAGSRGRIPDTLDGRRPTIRERLDGDPVPPVPRQSIPDRLAGKEPTIPERLEGVQPVRARTPEGRRSGGDETPAPHEAGGEGPNDPTGRSHGEPQRSGRDTDRGGADEHAPAGHSGGEEHSHANQPVVAPQGSQPHGSQPHGSQPHGEPQVAQHAKAGHPGSEKKFDAANDPKYDRPVERQRAAEQTLPDHRKGGEGRDPAEVDPGGHSDHDPTGRGQDELTEGVGSRQGQPRDRAVHALKRLFRWAHKVNLFDGSRALQMNCAEITRRICDILNGDPPRVAKGNRFGKGEWHDVTLEYMDLSDFPPENTFVRPPGHDGDLGLDNQALQLVRDRLHGRPPGTHANIGVGYKNGGHRFAAVVDLDGSVKWLDGQLSGEARKFEDGSPEQLEAIKRDLVKDGDSLPVTANIEHLHFAVREPGGRWEGPPRTKADESAAVMRHLREESKLKPSEPLDLDALPPSATRTMEEHFIAMAEHNSHPSVGNPLPGESLQGGSAGAGGRWRVQGVLNLEGLPAPHRGPAPTRGLPPDGHPGTLSAEQLGHLPPPKSAERLPFHDRHPGGAGGENAPWHFGPTGAEPPRMSEYSGVPQESGAATRRYFPSEWHQHDPWQSELADPRFRASKADQDAFRRQHNPYSAKQLHEFRSRGRALLPEGVIERLSDIDIQASEKLLTGFVEDMNRALHLGDVRVEQHPVIRNAISAMHKMPGYEGPVHRGVPIRDVQKRQAFIQAHELGGTVRYQGFTHSDQNLAGVHKYEVQVHIESRQGKDMTYLRPALSGIKEVIHLPHTDFYPVPVPKDWEFAPPGIDPNVTKYQDADGVWHLFVRDHTGPYHPSEAAPRQPEQPLHFGPLGSDAAPDFGPSGGS